MKQSVLAEMLGVDQASVSRWERGVAIPGLHIRRQLKNAFYRPFGDEFFLKHVTSVALTAIVLSNVDRIMQVMSPSYSADHGVPRECMIGQSTRPMYTPQGEAFWQEVRGHGFYRGDVASATVIARAHSLSGHRRNLPIKVVWTPNRLSDGEILLRAERIVLSESQFAAEMASDGGAVKIVTMDDLAA
jgi:hypothetical protein